MSFRAATRLGLILLALAGSGLLLALTGPSAAANSTRVTVANFQWSKNPVIDRGESVTWDWPGPDLQHSVSPHPAGSNPWDSDPGTSVPSHTLGDTFKVTFAQPGVYSFICKLHPTVKGTVTVRDEPGDPGSDPGPPPPLNFDFTPPWVDEWFFTRDGTDPSPGVITSVDRGIRFRFSTPERGSADVDYYRMAPVYRWKTFRKKTRRADGQMRIRKVKQRILVRRVRQYAGYAEWRTHVGYNVVRFGARSAVFPNPRPGRYQARFRVSDEVANTTRPIPLRFTVKAGSTQS